MIRCNQPSECSRRPPQTTEPPTGTVTASLGALKRYACCHRYSDTVISEGGSCIIGPLGEILAGPDFDGETILTTEIDFGEIARGKYDLDVAGHYARPDIFRLRVNERPMPPVVRTTGAPRDPFADELEEPGA